MFNEEGTVGAIACLSDSAAFVATRAHINVVCPYRKLQTPEEFGFVSGLQWCQWGSLRVHYFEWMIIGE